MADSKLANVCFVQDNELTLPSANPPYWKISKVPEAVVAEQGWRNCFLLEAGMEGNGTLVASLSHGVMVEDRLNGNWLLTNKQVFIGYVTHVFACCIDILMLLDYLLRLKHEFRATAGSYF